MKSKLLFHRRKLLLITSKGETIFYYSDLMHIKYDDPYCWLYFAGGSKYYAEISISKLLKELPHKPFFMCDRNAVINLCYYSGYDIKSSTITLEDGAKYKLSGRRVADFNKQKAGLKRISPPCHAEGTGKNEKCPDFGLFCVENAPE